MIRFAIFAIVTLSLTTSCTMGPAKVDPRPNVILFLVDDQGWTGTSLKLDAKIPGSSSDYYQTPHLERLAKRGMHFSQAYAPSPVCSPTRASIQTGKSPAQIHVTDLVIDKNYYKKFKKSHYDGKPVIPPNSINGLPKNEMTIAEAIKQARPEYATAHFGKWHLGAGGPTKHGYDIGDGVTSNANKEAYAKDPNPKDIFEISRRAITFMESNAKADRPFFLQISHYAVHLPERSLESTLDNVNKRNEGERHNRTPYAAMTEDLDSGLGRVLDAVDRLGLKSKTYIIYVSDNGTWGHKTKAYPWVIGHNHPLKKGKATTWEGGIRVPTVITGPGISKGVQCDIPMIGWDFLPTICDWLRINKLPQGIEGGSLRTVLENNGRGTIHRPREELVWYYPHYINYVGTKPMLAIRNGRYKLVEEMETGRSYLFDLTNDLEEAHDLSNTKPALLKTLKKQLETYLDDIKANRLKMK